MRKHDYGELNSLFKADRDYIENINALWNVRRGLHTIIEERPDLRGTIAPGFHTLNNIIGQLIKNRPYHPYTGFMGAEDPERLAEANNAEQ